LDVRRKRRRGSSGSLVMDGSAVMVVVVDRLGGAREGGRSQRFLDMKI
jgi:hypothetical protein